MEIGAKDRGGEGRGEAGRGKAGPLGKGLIRFARTEGVGLSLSPSGLKTKAAG